jgi:hypothetical protein
VITQSNNSGFDGSITNAVAEAFFSGHLEQLDEEVSQSEPTEDFDPDSFDALTGEFEMEEFVGFILAFTREGNTYFAQATGQSKIEMTPVSATEFVLVGVEARVVFNINEDGRADSITLHQNGTHRAKRIQDVPDEEADTQLDRYCGLFFSEELETFYDISLDKKGLVLNQRRFAQPVRLTGGKDHRFKGGFPIRQVEFELEESGEINGFTVSNGRTKGVQFERVE